MIKLNHAFLNDLGLADLNDAAKDSLLKHIYDQLELNVGTTISEQLSDSQMADFQNLIDSPIETAETFLNEQQPEWRQNPDFTREVQRANQRGIPEAPVIKQFAGRAWLQVNYPDYQKIVTAELEKIKAEVTENAPAIISAATTEDGAVGTSDQAA